MQHVVGHDHQVPAAGEQGLQRLDQLGVERPQVAGRVAQQAIAEAVRVGPAQEQLRQLELERAVELPGAVGGAHRQDLEPIAPEHAGVDRAAGEVILDQRCVRGDGAAQPLEVDRRPLVQRAELEVHGPHPALDPHQLVLPPPALLLERLDLRARARVVLGQGAVDLPVVGVELAAQAAQALEERAVAAGLDRHLGAAEGEQVGERPRLRLLDVGEDRLRLNARLGLERQPHQALVDLLLVLQEGDLELVGLQPAAQPFEGGLGPAVGGERRGAVSESLLRPAAERPGLVLEGRQPEGLEPPAGRGAQLARPLGAAALELQARQVDLAQGDAARQLGAGVRIFGARISAV